LKILVEVLEKEEYWKICESQEEDVLEFSLNCYGN
jgi:hypothetical protein